MKTGLRYNLVGITKKFISVKLKLEQVSEYEKDFIVLRLSGTN